MAGEKGAKPSSIHEEKGKGKRSAIHEGKGKGKRSAIHEEKGKGKRSSAQEHRGGGEERAPKIRKVTQEEMGKRKGKLQIKERDKPMELEKMRRLEERRGEKPFPKAPVTARMPDEKIALYRYVVQKDFEGMYFQEDGRFWSGGLDEVRRMNNTLRKAVKLVKEYSAHRLEEYNAKGYLEYCPTEANLSLTSGEGK